MTAMNDRTALVQWVMTQAMTSLPKSQVAALDELFSEYERLKGLEPALVEVVRLLRAYDATPAPTPAFNLAQHDVLAAVRRLAELVEADESLEGMLR